MISITRALHFDAGHRIPDHTSQCCNLHGHRYTLEITLEGEVVDAPGMADNGMVLDFAEVKTIAKQHVVDVWDHAFLVFEGDKEIVGFLESLPGHKTVVVKHVPTAENLAREAFNLLAPAYKNKFGKHLMLKRVRLYETPNCWADCTG